MAQQLDRKEILQIGLQKQYLRTAWHSKFLLLWLLVAKIFSTNLFCYILFETVALERPGSRLLGGLPTDSPASENPLGLLTAEVERRQYFVADRHLLLSLFSPPSASSAASAAPIFC